VDLNLAAVRPLQREGAALAGTEHDRRNKRLACNAQSRPEGDATRVERDLRAVCVSGGEGYGRRNRDALLLVGEQHTECDGRRRVEGRTGVVMREDLLVCSPVLRVAVGAVLAHLDAVPPAVA